MNELIRCIASPVASPSRRPVFTPAIVRRNARGSSGKFAMIKGTFTIDAVLFVGAGCRGSGSAIVRIPAGNDRRSEGSGGECPHSERKNLMNEQNGSEELIQIGECPICGQLVYWKPGNPGQKPIYCSWAHRQKAYRQRKKAGIKSGQPGRTPEQVA